MLQALAISDEMMFGSPFVLHAQREASLRIRGGLVSFDRVVQPNVEPCLVSMDDCAQLKAQGLTL